MSSFKAFYGYDAPNFTNLVFVEGKAPKAKDFLQEHQDIMKALKEILQWPKIAKRSTLKKGGKIGFLNRRDGIFEIATIPAIHTQEEKSRETTT